jgi:hypothetical protein
VRDALFLRGESRVIFRRYPGNARSSDKDGISKYVSVVTSKSLKYRELEFVL